MSVSTPAMHGTPGPSGALGGQQPSALMTRVSLEVQVHGLRQDEVVGVCFSQDGGKTFDIQDAVLLVEKLTAAAAAAGGGSTPRVMPAAGSSGGASAVSEWCTVKPLALARGVETRYRYGIFHADSGAFVRWETLRDASGSASPPAAAAPATPGLSGAGGGADAQQPGTSTATGGSTSTAAALGSRRLVPSGKTLALQDAFGELEEQRVQRRLDESAETARESNRAKTAQITDRLKTLFGPDRKLLLVTYSLPVILRKISNGSSDKNNGGSGAGSGDGLPVWEASWVEDDFLARTSNSIANDVPTVWVGAITRDCFDLTSTSTSSSSSSSMFNTDPAVLQAAAAQASSGPAVTLRPDPSAPVGERRIVDDMTAGGMPVKQYADEVSADPMASLDIAISVSPPSDKPAKKLAEVQAVMGPISLPQPAPIPSQQQQPASSPTASSVHVLPPIHGQAQGQAQARHPRMSSAFDVDASSPAAGSSSPLVAGASGGAVTAAMAGGSGGDSEDSLFSLDLTKGDLIAITRTLNAMNAVPLFIPTETREAFECYCMSVLKPCVHNVLETGAQKFFPYASSLAYLSEGWKAYLSTNDLFARELFSLYRPGDVVWLNDYPLCVVPQAMVKMCADRGLSRPPQAFFMHAPFPTSEIFRTLPVRDELLRGMLECDVVGFHTFNYARHFLQSVKRLLGVPFQSKRGGSVMLDVRGRDVMVAISHVGVEAEALDRWMASDAAAAVARHFADKYKGRVVIGGIDSCQRLSGVALKMLAFERLLEENPVYRKKVVLVQRCEMRGALTTDMRKTSSELRERVLKIRSLYGADTIDYEEAVSYPSPYRVGLFHRADILALTSIREGLNMSPLEYVYARTQWQMQRAKQYVLQLAKQDPEAYYSALPTSPRFAPTITAPPHAGAAAGGAAKRGRGDEPASPSAKSPSKSKTLSAVVAEQDRGLSTSGTLSGSGGLNASGGSTSSSRSASTTANTTTSTILGALSGGLGAAAAERAARAARVVAEAAAAGFSSSASDSASGRTSPEICGDSVAGSGANTNARGSIVSLCASTISETESQLAYGRGRVSREESDREEDEIAFGVGKRQGALQPLHRAATAGTNALVSTVNSLATKGQSTHLGLTIDAPRHHHHGARQPSLNGSAGSTPDSAPGQLTGGVTPSDAGGGATSTVTASAAQQSHTEAEVKAMAIGMPVYYATLAAPPSRAGANGAGRKGVAGLFRPPIAPPHHHRSASGAKDAAAGDSNSRGSSRASSGQNLAMQLAATGAALSSGSDSDKADAESAAAGSGGGIAGSEGKPALAASLVPATGASTERALTRQQPHQPQQLGIRAGGSGVGLGRPSSLYPSSSPGAGALTLATPLMPQVPIPVDDAPLTAPLPPPIRGGCVMISEFSTASHVLNSNILLNPWSIGSVARELDKALLMPDHERSFRQWRDYQYAVRNPAGSWSRRVILDAMEVYTERQEAALAAPSPSIQQQLSLPVDAAAAAPTTLATGADADAACACPPVVKPSAEGVTISPSGLTVLPVEELVKAYRNAKRRVLVIDYGGTLVGKERETWQGASTKTDFTIDGYSKQLPQLVLEGLAGLSQDPRNHLYVISGLRTAAIDALHLSRLPRVGLAAENGMLVSEPRSLLLPSPSAVALQLTENLGATPTPTPATVAAQSAGGLDGFHPHHNNLPSSWPLPAHALSPSSSSSSSSSLLSGASVAAVPASSPSSSVQQRAAIRHAASFTPQRSWQRSATQTAEEETRWRSVKAQMLAVMQEYQWRVNGSVVREYDYLLAWDFRNADAEWAQAQARFMAADLQSFAPAELVRVSVRKTQVEASLRAMDKGRFLVQTLQSLSDAASAASAYSGTDSRSSASRGDEADDGDVDFLLVAGDDTTDEDLFAAAQAAAGDAASNAAAAAFVNPAALAMAGVGSIPSTPAVQATTPTASNGPSSSSMATLPLLPAGLTKPVRKVYSILVGRPKTTDVTAGADGFATSAKFVVPDVQSMQALVCTLKAAGAPNATGAGAQ